MFATVTFRSIEALLRLVEDYPAWADAAPIAALDKAIPALLAKKEEEIHSTLGLKSEGGILNPFSLSLYVDCLSKISGCRRTTQKQRQGALEKLLRASEHLLKYTTLQNPTQVGAVVHPFVLFHLIRAIEAAGERLTDTILLERLGTFRNTLIAIVRKQGMQLLAQDSLGMMNPSEGVALAFCGAALSTCQEPEETPFVNAALRVAFKFQDTSGCWPLGRIVPENKDIEVHRELQISAQAGCPMSSFLKAPAAETSFKSLVSLARPISGIDPSISHFLLDSSSRLVLPWTHNPKRISVDNI
jgi:hypothetical protein